MSALLTALWWQHLWGAMWPNVFAPSVFTLLGLLIAHVRAGVKARRRHEEALTLAARHHREQIDQAATHHADLQQKAEDRHRQLVENTAVHHELLAEQLGNALAADAPVSGGAGSNPATSEGLPADAATVEAAERVVPPPAARKPRTRRPAGGKP